MIANTPNPPYYAVIFTNELTVHTEGYEAMAEKMCEMALKEPGCLGFESVRNGLGITISYWESLEAIKSWKANTEHLEAQQQGRDIWYKNYKTRICKVERDYGFERNDDQQ
ncbi:antibiotic biosynthesis monooxygenase [Sediminibacterium sp.]|uniref:antibiotic biosynthesis monooxygenase family protein n=1 Tax=Sediminibacterium sp. TaxID=1917865 RepID=UPI0025EA0F93|nr:antibiotic biosynthesis monooxygenase [Sediminibacterium sp.]MBW0178205.1 antibiotic biosynthesis monooxygenase [Sediminibacterium sp.]